MCSGYQLRKKEAKIIHDLKTTKNREDKLRQDIQETQEQGISEFV